jgi:hypothetical protein
LIKPRNLLSERPQYKIVLVYLKLKLKLNYNRRLILSFDINIMAPKEIGSEKANVLANTKESLQEERGIHQVQSSHGTGPSSTFTHCNSIGPYVAYQDPYSSPVKVNKSLNLHFYWRSK